VTTSINKVPYPRIYYVNDGFTIILKKKFKLDVPYRTHFSKSTMRNVDLYFLNKEEPYKGCLLALRKCILSNDPHITETQKYGMPCYCFKGKAFCYLWTDKKTQFPYILFVEGQYLIHQRLETGKRARMKIFPVDPKKDLPYTTIDALVQDALLLYKNGTIPIK